MNMNATDMLSDLYGQIDDLEDDFRDAAESAYSTKATPEDDKAFCDGLLSAMQYKYGG